MHKHSLEGQKEPVTMLASGVRNWGGTGEGKRRRTQCPGGRECPTEKVEKSDCLQQKEETGASLQGREGSLSRLVGDEQQDLWVLEGGAGQ